MDQDECVLWTVPVGEPNAVLRTVAVDLGDDRVPSGYVWVGGYRGQEGLEAQPERRPSSGGDRLTNRAVWDDD